MQNMHLLMHISSVLSTYDVRSYQQRFIRLLFIIYMLWDISLNLCIFILIMQYIQRAGTQQNTLNIQTINILQKSLWKYISIADTSQHILISNSNTVAYNSVDAWGIMRNHKELWYNSTIDFMHMYDSWCSTFCESELVDNSRI